MRDRTWVMLIASGVLLADQVSKRLVSSNIALGDRIPLIDGWLALNHVQNRGAAFGLFADAPPGPVRIGLVIVSVLAVALIWAYAREGWNAPRTVAAFGLILGGAVGNLVDRLWLHHVVDFIDVSWGQYHWPSFNFADTAITVGALTLFVAMAQHDDIDEPSPASAGPRSDRLGNLAASESSAKDRPAEDTAALN